MRTRIRSTERIPGRLLPAVLLAALVLAPAAVDARGALGSTHRDDFFGFMLGPPKDWNVIPPQPDEPRILVKYIAPSGAREAGQLWVLGFEAPSEEEAEEEPGGTGGAGLPPEFRQMSRPPANFLEWVGRTDITVTEDGEWTNRRRDRAVRYRVRTNRSEGFAYDFERDDGSHVVLLFFAGISDGLREECLDSFRLTRRAAVSRASRETGGDDAARLSREQKIRLLSVPGWWTHEVGPYVIVTNLHARTDRRFVSQIAERLMRIRGLYEKKFPAVEEVTAVNVVRICKNQEEYHQYGGPPGSGGYWYSVTEELVLFDRRGEPEGIEDTYAVLQHEAFHQYIYYCFGELSPHTWYNEGWGDYFSGAQAHGSRSYRIRPFHWRLGLIQEMMRNGRTVPLPEFLRYSHARHYANAGPNYAQGWSLVYFLNEGLEEDHPWGRILPTYFETLAETRDTDRALAAAFEGIDFADLEPAWKEFILGLEE